jgi:hypothetical protein
MKDKLSENQIKNKLARLRFYHGPEDMNLSDRELARVSKHQSEELDDFDGKTVLDVIETLKHYLKYDAIVSVGTTGSDYYNNRNVEICVEWRRPETDEEYADRIQYMKENAYKSWKGEYDSLQKQLEQARKDAIAERDLEELSLKRLAKKLGYKLEK